MATIVIVPGGFHGGWRWKEVRAALQAAGHEVYATTLTGLGERSHLASPEIGLDTHIQDVVNVLEYEDLREVVLIGHSYGGMVVTAVADRAAGRLARLVYLDALLPHDGECAFDVRPRRSVRALRSGRGTRRGLAGPAVEPIGLAPGAHPLRTCSSRCASRDPAGSVPGVYIRCTAWTGGGVEALARSADRARERGWPMYELATGHSPQSNEAERELLLALLLKIV